MGLAENLRIDCYVSVMKKFRLQYPQARFEIIMREPFAHLDFHPHVLSPSYALLKAYKYQDKSFSEFAEKLEEELFNNHEAVQKMRELRLLAENNIVFLVCCEKESNLCHRSLVQKYILHLDYFLEKWILPPL